MPGEQPNLIKDEALKLYDEQAWFVIPTDPGAKKPYYGFTYKDRYGDRLPSREEVASWPEWNAKSVRLGARTGAVSGIIVLDVDSQEAHDFVKSKGHPIGPMVQSPRESGGLHLYFKHPGFYVKSTVEVGGVEGLDIRGDYGIVVLPPSIDHKAGRSYEWIIPPEDVAVPPAPDWLVELLKKQASSKERLDVPKIMAGIPEGQRDTALNRLAGKFRYMNLPEDVAIPMIELAAERCKPPFNKAEARAKVKWAYTHYEPGEDVGPALSVKAREARAEGFSTFTAFELANKEFPAVRWVVPNLIPEGTMLLAGKPKMGKSWFALQLCIAVATGEKALEEIEVDRGEALYLALEDNERRLQDRLNKLLAGREAPRGLHMTTVSNRVDSGLLEDLEEFLEANQDVRLVVIDTIVKVRPQGSTKQTLYEQDYEAVSALTDLAGLYNVAIILVHHLKKGEAEDILDLISGSTGLTGGVDGALVLNRTRSAADAILKAAHRDLKDDPELALAWDSERAVWKLIGDAEEYRLGKERREILDVLANADGPMKPIEIAEALDKPTPNISKLLQKMRDDGYVDNEGYGKYVIGATPHPPTIQVIQPIQVTPEVNGELGSLGLLGTDTVKDDEEIEWLD